MGDNVHKLNNSLWNEFGTTSLPKVLSSSLCETKDLKKKVTTKTQNIIRNFSNNRCWQNVQRNFPASVLYYISCSPLNRFKLALNQNYLTYVVSRTEKLVFFLNLTALIIYMYRFYWNYACFGIPTADFGICLRYTIRFGNHLILRWKIFGSLILNLSLIFYTGWSNCKLLF